MNKDEAIAWLKGERSTWNHHATANPINDMSAAAARCAEDDAAHTAQAYWVLRAYKEGLIPPS